MAKNRPTGLPGDPIGKAKEAAEAAVRTYEYLNEHLPNMGTGDTSGLGAARRDHTSKDPARNPKAQGPIYNPSNPPKKRRRGRVKADAVTAALAKGRR